MRVLLVEDDPRMVDALTHALRRSEHNVDYVPDSNAAKLRITTEIYDIVILGLPVSGRNRLNVLREFRVHIKNVPTIVLSASGDRVERIQALDAGADDYMVMPLDVAELEARIRAIARRALAQSGGDIVVGRLRLRLAVRQVFLDNSAIKLPRREYAVLECLMLRHGRVVSKDQLMMHVGNWDKTLTEGAIEIYIHRLRSKIALADAELLTVRGFGYILTVRGDGSS